jgi:UDP-N-acetylglucosamine kinase
LAGSPRVVGALEALPFITRVRVFSRERLLHDTTSPDTSGGEPAQQSAAAEVLRGEQTRILEPAEAVAWLAWYRQVFGLARARPGYLGPATAPAFRLLQADAETMIRTAAGAPGVDVAEVEREQHWRRLSLDQVAPEPARSRVRQALRRLTRGSDPGPEDPWQAPGRPGPHRRDPPGRSL